MIIKHFNRALATIALLLFSHTASAIFMSNGLGDGFLNTDGNTTVDVRNVGQRGLVNWVVDGVDQSFQDWFWVGNGTNETSIDNFAQGPAAINLNTGNLTLSFDLGNSISLAIEYSVIGGAAGSGQSTVNQHVTVTNTLAGRNGLDLFHYVDLDLANSSGNESATYDPQTGLFTQSDIANDTLAEISSSLLADTYEISNFSGLLTSLNDGAVTTLANNTSANNIDVTAGFEYRFRFADAGSIEFDITNVLNPVQVPEPASLALLSLGLLGFAAATRRRRRN